MLFHALRWKRKSPGWLEGPGWCPPLPGDPGEAQEDL